MTSPIDLPDIVDPSEVLSRNLIETSNSVKARKALFTDPEDCTQLKPGLFFDEKRSPEAISVNRFSTIGINGAHRLGLQHLEQDREAARKAYYGFGELIGKKCIEEGCRLTKEDDAGVRPFHAHINYPGPQTSKDYLVASALALKSEVRLSETAKSTFEIVPKVSQE